MYGQSLPACTRDIAAERLASRLYFGNTREPWGMTVVSQQIYVMTSASDVSAVHKNIDRLTFDDYIEDMMLRFGASKKAVGRKMRTPDQLEEATASCLQLHPSMKSLLHHFQSLYNQALHPGEKLDTTAQDAMDAYFHLPQQQRPSAAWLIQTLEAETRARGIGSTDIAALLVMTFWVVNGNAYKLCFWVLTHILYVPSLLAATRAEVLSTVRDSASPNELASNLEKCLRLNAVFNETLRTTTSSSTIRNVVDTITVGGKRLHKGNKVLVPYRQLHFDDRASGKNPQVFDSDPFFDRKELSKSSNFRPFGGGATYCPGRFVAKREVLTFVALALARLDIKVAEQGKGEIPSFPHRGWQPCLEIMGPRLGCDTVLEISRIRSIRHEARA
ncbi:MAG: hypothetical protein Q9204_005510 [Flavoplaca sp. TL-2023a]